jgi:glutathione S-transferase
MSKQNPITFYHSAKSRSLGTLILLEELAAKYELRLLDMSGGETRGADYLAVNPMGKVPAITHGDALITEQPAIFIYLADLYAQAGLAPQMGDPLRGPYLRWMVFYGSCFEPAIIDRSMQREGAAKSTSPYGDFDTMFSTLTGQLGKGEFFLGDRFSALDVLWGTALTWISNFKLIPETAVIQTYIERFNARPAVQRMQARDADFEASHA